MKKFCLALGLSLLPALAGAQVVVNHAALDQLAGIVAAPPVFAAPAPAVHRVVVRRRVVHRPAPPMVVAAKPAAPVAVLPVVAKPAAPKPSPGAAIRFASGSADLPTGAAATLQPFCAAHGLVTISATAPDDPADRSAALRMAMLRAFAVRGALTGCGLPSADILPLAVTAGPGRDPDMTQITAAP